MISYSLLVSTVNGLFLIEDGQYQKILNGHLYGITWDKIQIYLSSHTKPEISIWTGEADFYNCSKVLFPHRMDDSHQLLWIDNKLYVAHTGHNRIDVWDGKEAYIYQWLDTVQNGKQAPDHINSIWFYDNKFYVCEHRYGAEPARIRVLNQQFQILKTFDFYNLDHSHSSGIHNVYIEDDILYTLAVNCLIKQNLINNQIEAIEIRQSKDIGYLRGFARNKDAFFIGESRVSIREDRRKNNAIILILDDNLQLIDTIELQDSGDCHDIRLLDNDKAHNGLSCPKVWERS